MPISWAMRCSSGMSFCSRVLRSVVVSMRLCLSLQVVLERHPVGRELLETEVGEWVFDELSEHINGHGRDIGPRFSGFDHMHRMTQRSRQHLGLVPLYRVDVGD